MLTPHFRSYPVCMDGGLDPYHSPSLRSLKSDDTLESKNQLDTLSGSPANTCANKCVEGQHNDTDLEDSTVSGTSYFTSSDIQKSVEKASFCKATSLFGDITWPRVFQQRW